MSSLQTLHDRIHAMQGRYDFIMQSLAGAKTCLKNLKREKEDLEKVQGIIQRVAIMTQEQFQAQVSSLVTMGMNTVFDDPYEMKLEFVERRNKTEVDVLFERDEKIIDPLSCSGGGAIDVASLTFQICLLSIQNKKCRRILILDEPLKWLKGSDLPRRGAELIKQISEKLGIQVIMISHDPELIESADRIFHVSIRNGTSIVKEKQC